MMKRESGANPEQTRCCKSFKIFEYTPSHCLLADGKAFKDGQVRRPARNNIVLMLSGNKAVKQRVWYVFIFRKEIISLCKHLPKSK